MDLTSIVTLLWYGSVGLLGILSAILVFGGKWPRYKAFTLFILCLTAEGVVLLFALKSPLLYGQDMDILSASLF